MKLYLGSSGATADKQSIENWQIHANIWLLGMQAESHL